jgi:uncharacterized protein (TIGR02246 family)
MFDAVERGIGEIAYSIWMRSITAKGGRLMKKVLMATALALAVLVPGQTMADESLRDTIQSREDQWSAAYNANSKELLSAFYEEGAVLIPPGSPPINGPIAIADFLSTLFPQLHDMKLVTDDVKPLGPDYAVEIGHSEYDAVAEDGSKSPGVDDYQVVWHKGDDGVWRYVTDMFNSR